MVEGNITPIRPDGLEPKAPKKAPPAAAPEGERSFASILEQSIDAVNQLQQEADLSVVKFNKDQATLDEVMVSFQKAKIAFDALTQIRNKLLDAFEELQRMRI
jgi:flagellar hook-basal body complex protein FliE